MEGSCRSSEEIYNEGVEQGVKDKLIENVRSMIKNLEITDQQALDALDVPSSKQARYIALLYTKCGYS